MPIKRTISAPMRAALLTCFQEAANLVRPSLRQQFVLEAAQERRSGFTIEADGKIAFDAPQGFRVRMDLLEIGNGAVEHIYATEPLSGASLASRSDLVRLRAKTVVERGSEGEIEDLRWLVAATAKNGEQIPILDQEEIENVVGASASLKIADQLLLVAVLGAYNEAMALRILGI